MIRCSKCNNEIVADARFCNICGTPIEVASAAPTNLKRTIYPDSRRVHPSREGQTNTASLTPESRDETPNKPVSSDGPETIALTKEKQNTPRPSNPPFIPKTTFEFTSVKGGQAREKQQSVSLDGTPQTSAQSKEVADAATPPLSDQSSSAPAKTAPLPSATPVPDKKTLFPPPNSGQGRAPGIIRPIVTTTSLRQNVPTTPGQTPPNPMSPLPALPNTPALPGEKTPQLDKVHHPRSVNTPMPSSLAQDNQRQAERPKQEPATPQPPVQPNANNNAGWRQAMFNVDAMQTPLTSLHDMPTNYLELQNGTRNGANGAGTANRQDLPLFSPESFAYTSKAAEHWRGSWRDLQNAEAGPAEHVSKGQASVPAPLAARKESFIRLRAIRTKENQDAGEKNFGFWVTLFLMICLIGGLAAYIIYSYLPNASLGAARVTQPAGAQQPSLVVMGTASQAFISGQSLQAHGEHFGANDSIEFLLDNSTPVLATNGGALRAQSNSQGAFDAIILISKNWAFGTHIIQATDSHARLSASLDIEVNPNSSPVTSSNDTDLSFSLNGQSIKQLSFTAQSGQLVPPTQRITFTNKSGAVMQWSAAASTDHNLDWLTIVDSDFSGQLDIQQPHSMGLIANPASLSVTAKGNAPYKGQIVFTINGNKQLTLPVQLTIIDATPEMVFSPNPLVAAVKSDGTCASGITLTFINLGTSVITWSANPDNPNNIQFVNTTEQLTEQGRLQPSGMNGDTTVVTLHCSGVKVGDKYIVNVYANTAGPFTETVFIG
jgi:zinc-ribbon domain